MNVAAANLTFGAMTGDCPRPAAEPAPTKPADAGRADASHRFINSPRPWFRLRRVGAGLIRFVGNFGTYRVALARSEGGLL